MATKTFEELKQMAIQIRDEKTNKQNTATRIGTQMVEHLNKLEQEYYDKMTLDKRVTELNISELFPTEGVDGSNKYTLAGAIAKVDSKYRTIVGLKITFINNTTSKTETWKYDGGTFTTTTNWKQGDGSGGNLILAWNTDVATTRKQVLQQERKKLLQISYENADGEVINEQYIGTTFTDIEWINDKNWERLLDSKDKEEIESKILGLNFIPESDKSSNLFGVIVDAENKVVLKIDKLGYIYGLNLLTPTEYDNYKKVLSGLFDISEDDCFLRIVDKEKAELLRINSDGSVYIPLLVLSETSYRKIAEYTAEYLNFGGKQDQIWVEGEKIQPLLSRKGYIGYNGNLKNFNSYVHTFKLSDLPDVFKYKAIGLANNIIKGLADIKITKELENSAVIYAEKTASAEGNYVEVILEKSKYLQYGEYIHIGTFNNTYFEMFAMDKITQPTFSTKYIGKTMVWIGTSIPAGGVGTSGASDIGVKGSPLAYPAIVGRLLGARIYNESVGESGCRIGGAVYADSDDYPTEFVVNNVQSLYNLSETKAEKIKHRDWLNSNMGTNFQSDFAGYSYETKLIERYFDTESENFIEMADYLVIDHAHNDNNREYADTFEQFTTPPAEHKYARTTFIGSVNYVIRECMKYNPKLKIIVISHHIKDSAYNTTPDTKLKRLAEATKNLAAFWNAPYCPLHDLTGFSEEELIYSDAYWKKLDWFSSEQKVLIPHGNEEGYRYVSSYYIAQNKDVHPAADATGENMYFLAQCIANWMKSN